MAKTQHIIILLVLSALMVTGLAWFSESRTKAPELLLTEETEDFMAPLTPEEQEVVNPESINVMNPTAIIKTNQGVIELELFASQMPVTVGNFVKLANEDFYDGVKFHRVIDGFMIQSGDPNTKTPNEATWGRGGPGYSIADEHVSGENLTNTRGTISMANSGPNSGGSQWFINLTDNTLLDFDKQPLQSKHPVFGQVTSGMDVVDAIGVVETKSGDVPVEPIVIESIEIVEGLSLIHI